MGNDGLNQKCVDGCPLEIAKMKDMMTWATYVKKFVSIFLFVHTIIFTVLLAKVIIEVDCKRIFPGIN